MTTPAALPGLPAGVRRRDLLKAGLAAGLTLSSVPLSPTPALWGAEAAPPKRGGILRVRGWDPPHFDHHFTLNFKTNTTLSLAYSTLVRYKVGAEVRPGTFTIEPHLAERWEQPDPTTYIFHLRHGVKWHNKPPLNGREFVADDVKFTYDRFLAEPSNPLRFTLEAIDHIEVLDRYTVKFILKEPFAWLVNVLANPYSTWIVAPEVVKQFGDLKKPESVIGTGPFILERYEPNVKAVFKRNPDYFIPGQPYVDGVEWLIIDDLSTGLAMYRTGQIDCGPAPWWSVRQQDLEALKKTHPNLMYQDFLSNVTGAVIYMRTDMPPFNDVRVRRAISMAIDRQGIIEGVYVRGEPTPAIARGATEWSLPIDQLGAGAKYYQHDPKEARRLLAEAGFAKGFKTTISTTGGYGPDLTDAVQLAQRDLKEVGIDAEMKMQEYGAYMATTFLGKYEGLAMGPMSITWEPDSVLYGMYAPDQPRNSAHVNDPKLTAILKEQRHTQDLEARKKLIFDIQRYVAEQQYYIYTNSIMITGTWQPYVKNYAPNSSFDYGGRIAALWLDR
jgi:peptide/nickel transport system substrate-binding protein